MDRFSGLSIAIWLALTILMMIVREGEAFGEEQIQMTAYKTISLKEVCANRQVPIISISEVKRMIKELKRKPELCSESYRQSFYELEPILRETKHDRVCGERKFNQIAEYHFRYINPKVEQYTMGDNLDNLEKKIVKRPLTEDTFDEHVQLDRFNQEIMIPISLQQFFKAWALQVSGLCKKALVDNLEPALQTFMTDEDLELINKAIANPREVTDPISKKPLNKLTFDELVYMPELEGFKSDEEETFYRTKRVLDLRNNEEADRFMHACQSRFKPIYAKLVLPVVRLAKLGYDYLGSRVTTINNKFESCPETRRWLALTSICEAPGNFELVERDENPIQMERLDYEPLSGHKVENDLWIKGAANLKRELELIRGSKSSGYKRALWELGKAGRKAVAFVDPHQFAWYRRNQNTLSSVLNSLSIASNGFSIGLTLAGAGRR